MTQAKAKRKRRFHPAFFAVPVVVVAAAAFALTRPKTEATSNDTKKAETATAVQQTFRVSVTGPGTLEAAESLDVKPEVNGIVATLPKEGKRVTKGELVATLKQESFARSLENARLGLEKARAQLESTRVNQASNRANQNQSLQNATTQLENAKLDVQNAQTTFANQQRLYQVGGISRTELQNAQLALEKTQNSLQSTQVAYQTARDARALKDQSDAQDLRNTQLALEQAEITYRNAQTDYGKTKIYAARNGVVSGVAGQVGGPASSGQALFTLLEDNSVDLPVQVDETEIAKVKLGQRAEIALDALGDEKFKGVVTSISPKATIQQNIAVFYVTVTIDNPALQLRPGMTAEAEIISQQLENVVQIPKRAVRSVRRRAYVTIQTQDADNPKETRSEEVRVELGPDDGTTQVILQGLSDGQTVVLPTRERQSSTSTAGSP